VERTLSNVRFAAGHYSLTVSVKGPVTEKPEFAATLDYMFGLWSTVINGRVKPGSYRGEEHLKAVTKIITDRLGDNTIDLEVTFCTDTSGLDEASVASVLARLSSLSELVLDAFVKGTTSQGDPADMLKGLLDDIPPFNFLTGCPFAFDPQSSYERT
jgi:hypothetical protein